MALKKYAVRLLAFSALGGIFAAIYVTLKVYKLRGLPEKYVVNKYRPTRANVLYLDKLRYEKQYYQYVKDNMSTMTSIPVNFPFGNILAKGDKIYVRGYVSDSTLVEFFSPEHHNKIWSFTTGYVHRDFVQDTLPE